VESEKLVSLAIAGGCTLGGLWLVSSMVGGLLTDLWSSSRDTQSAWPLFIPVAGPFIGIGTTEAQSAATFMLVLDGVLQTAGLASFIAGLAVEKQVLIRDDVAQVTVDVAPIVGPSSAGIGIHGTF